MTVTSSAGGEWTTCSSTRIFSGWEGVVCCTKHGSSFPREAGLSIGLSSLRLSAVADLGLASSPASMNGMDLCLIHGNFGFDDVVEKDCLDSGLSFSSTLFLASTPNELLVCGAVPSLVFGLSNGLFLTDPEDPSSAIPGGTETVDIELLAPPGLPKGDLDATEPCLFSENSGGLESDVGPSDGLANGDRGANLGP